MKKVISLLLVVTIISALLVGCDLMSIFNKNEIENITPTTTTTTTITTTTNSAPLYPENPTIEHGDNFTDEDIEFLMHLHGQKMGGNDNVLMFYTLSEIIHNAQSGSPLLLMHFENPYAICAYLKPNPDKYQKDEDGYYYFDVSKYVWYKFFEGETVPGAIDDMQLTSFSYLLFDCTIVRDIANSIEYNKQCKYYARYYSEISFTQTTSDMIMYFSDKNVASDDSQFVEESPLSKTTYEVFIDENGVEYLFFKYRRYLPDGTLAHNYDKNFFVNYNGDFCDIVSPYYEVLKEITEEDGDLIQYAGIRLDILMQIEINE